MRSSPRRSGLSVLLSLVLLLGSLLVAGAAAAAPSPEAGNGTLTGFAHDLQARGLDGVTVEAFAVGSDPDVDPPVGTTGTPSETGRAPGNWYLELPQGEYRLRFSGAGLQTQWYGGGAGRVVQVAEGLIERLPATSLRGTATAVVHGTVHDDLDHRAVHDILVEAVDADGLPAASALTYSSDQFQSDGYFALHLDAGTWTIRASDPDGRGYEPIEMGEVTVAAGEEKKLGDFRVSRRTGQVAVSVVDGLSRPLARPRVKIREVPGAPYFKAKGRADEDGTIVFTGVPESTDSVTVCADAGTGWVCLGGVRKRRAAETLHVVGGQTTLAEVVVDQVLVTGSVVDQEGRPIMGADVDIISVEGDSYNWAGNAPSDASGRFAVAMLRTADTAYTACVYGRAWTCLGGRSNPARAHTFTIPTDVAEHEIAEALVLDNRPPTTVTSTVRTVGGNKVVAPILQALRWDGDEWTAVSESVGDGSGRVSAELTQGTYTFRFLRAGFAPLVLGGGSELPGAPVEGSSVEVGADPVDLGTVLLQPRPRTSAPTGGEYGPAYDHCLSNYLPPNDDESSDAVALPFALSFFGQPYSDVFVNNNGNVTFGEELSAYTPSAFSSDAGGGYSGPPIIAPFFADVDTRGEGSNVVTYGASPDGSSFCVNWVDVGYFSHATDRLNSFQLLLTQRSGAESSEGDFDITFNYDQLQWDIGEVSDVTALAGFTAGTPDVPGTVIQLDGSLEPGALLDDGPNSLVGGTQNAGDRLGRYLFPVRNGEVSQLLGGLSGQVVDESGDPVPGALVEPCRAVSGVLRCAGVVRTNSDGHFTSVGLPEGSYQLRVSPPAGSAHFPTTASGTVVRGVTTALESPVLLTRPRPAPAGVELGNSPGADPWLPAPYIDQNGVYVVHYRAPLDLVVEGCPGVADPAWSLVVEGVERSAGVLVESAPGVYRATVPSAYPEHGEATLTTTVLATCDATRPVVFDLYIDPSGVVTDQYGQPLDAVRTELMRADTGAGPFTPVPDGSAIMSPSNRVNPDVTSADGVFRWDVLAGYYRVDATKAGCTPTSTAEMEVPPERLDLLIKMTCAAAAVTPLVAPEVQGVPAVGTVLTATAGTWPGALVPTRVEWLRGATVVGTDPAYTPVAADAGRTLTMVRYAKRPDYLQENRADGARVSFEEARFELPVAVPAAPGGGGGGGGGTPPPAAAPVNTVAPSIGGDAEVGGALTAQPGTWDTEGLTFAYQWMRDGEAIAGATASGYTATKDDLGRSVNVRVTASRTGRTDGTAMASPVVVAAGGAPTVVTAPKISGEPVVGGLLSVSEGTWSAEGLSFAYQWTRDGEPIAGATGATYTLGAADKGTLVGVLVTASRAGYADGSAVAEGLAVPGDEQPEEPVSSKTKVKVLDRPVRADERARLKVVVRTVGEVVPTGVIEVTLVGGRTLTRDLDADEAGVQKLKLPKLAAGKYRVKVRYLGSEDVEASKAQVLRVRVKPARSGTRAMRADRPGRSMVDLW
ncbi:Dioxygenase [Nocardioides dokdonensis FR1436]|uniref:Dioxygenase n=1 Tax=Nocardioides dokdonensis FR1436 TaxID=1300347 RepID=A0A1A9GKW5_9ACTN|nr:carboxypeptidase regulatory-like domain-containing protein [Nocardioides dokdonensis]ANH38095.1 Dioxygenase [Nocardioides dokdonensis FR1436]